MRAIRPLKREDEAQVLSLNTSALPHVAPLDKTELARLQSLSKTHLVAEEGESLLGYALTFAKSDPYDGEEFLTFRMELPEPFIYIDQVVVLDSVRNGGVGRMLYESVEEVASTGGYAWLCCEVNVFPPNSGSLAFHSRLGFSIFRDLATGDGRRVRMLKKSVPYAT
jgi:uncharacterized protein